MEDLLNFQKHRWGHDYKDPVLVLQEQESEASAVLASHRSPVNAGNLFAVLMSTPFVTGSGQHGRRISKNEQLLALTFSSASQPSLPFRVPSRTSECSSCADLSDLRVEKIHLSGSVREGTHVRVWSQIGSDVDAMFHLAPVRVLSATAGPAAAPPSRRTSSDVELRVEATPSPGYFLLKHVRRDGCQHPGELSLTADRAVGLLDVFRARLDEEGTARREGPALSTHVADFQQHWRSIDLVPCVTADGCWPRSGFANRVRRSGQPSRTLALELADLLVFLVPVGLSGSPTEHDEWRVSFSRHEYILLRDMSETQRSCLTLLKTCKAMLGLHGLKSYHLKTALMWLCEMRPRVLWTRDDTKESLLEIISFLENALCQKSLPCYFWPEMNILANRNAAQLSEISSDLLQLKRHLLSCSLALVTNWLCGNVSDVAERLLFSEIPLPRSDSLTVRLLMDTFLERRQNSQANFWAFVHRLFTSTVRPGTLPMPFAECFSLLFRSVKKSLKSSVGCPNGGAEMLGAVLTALRAIQDRDVSTPDEEDSWMMRP